MSLYGDLNSTSLKGQNSAARNHDANQTGPGTGLSASGPGKFFAYRKTHNNEQEAPMTLTRRNILAIGGAAVTVSLIPVNFARATPEAAREALNAFTDGAPLSDGGIELTAPEIAENGNTVPISVSAPGAVEILILSEGNPSPGIAKFTFGEGAAGSAATRIRLAGTQNVLAVARMADGSFLRTARAVKVTIGGCGG